MTKSLPPKANLEQLKNQAKDILKAHKSGDTSCCHTFRQLHDYNGKPDDEIIRSKVSLSQVQFALAIEYGFKSWSELKARVAVQMLAAEGAAHWQRFSADDEENVKMVCGDPEWSRLLELEVELGPVSAEAQKIRSQIASLESCHESYVGNVRQLLDMVGTMTPSFVLDCGNACGERKQQATARRVALETWQSVSGCPVEADEMTKEVFDILGVPDADKRRLVAHLISKVSDNGYAVYADEDEDFELTESRIQHLDICNYNWLENLRIVIHEIAAGKRLHDWHVPEGYNSCGDLPDRTVELRPLMMAAAAWAEQDGRAVSGPCADGLGKSTPEKRWLVAWLCKNVSSQHAKLKDSELLPTAAI
jgi:hypothetical protein